ncbi:unnamed protein product, partial [Ixodes persulcatus]
RGRRAAIKKRSDVPSDEETDRRHIAGRSSSSGGGGGNCSGDANANKRSDLQRGVDLCRICGFGGDSPRGIAGERRRDAGDHAEEHAARVRAAATQQSRGCGARRHDCTAEHAGRRWRFAHAAPEVQRGSPTLDG